jgi:CzcA family heavy metal efflux pump
MLNAIIRFSLKHRALVLVLTAFVMVYGGLMLQRLPVDVFPDLNRPTVTVITDAHGMAPEEVEIVITRAIESVLNGAPGVTRLYSSSTTGLSVVRAEFEWGTDLKLARLAVSERLQLARERLPKDLTPFLSPTSSIMGEIQMIGLTASGPTTQAQLRTFADWTLRTRLLTIPGVSQVIVLGGDELQAQVLVNADKLRKRQISILDLKERLAKISEASGGGFITDGGKEWLIRNVGRILHHDEIAKTAVGTHFGRPVLLKDVARVEFAPAPKRGDASINGKPGVILMVHKQPAADTLKVSDRVDRALKGMGSALPADVTVHGDLFKQSNFIRAAIGNVLEALRDGSLMVTLVLILFLMNIRTTLITLTAIPVSLLITAVVFNLFNVGVNTMTLGGLAIAIGELVDDTIVDVENVFRRLRENRGKGQTKRVLRVVYEASSEVRNSIVLATVIVALVFVPLFALPGLEGRLFVPIGIAYVVSLLASLLVSLTLTPVLCSYFLAHATTHKDNDGWLVTRLKSLDSRILEKTLDHPGRVITGTALAVLLAAAAVPLMGRNFLPPFNEGSAMAEINTQAGISLEASSQLALQAEKALLQVPEVISVGRRTGRAEEDDHAASVNHSEFEIALRTSQRPRSAVFNDLRDKIKSVLPPEGNMALSQPITHRLDHVLSGVKSQVAVKLFGPDLRVLRQYSAEIKNAVHDVPGVVDLQIEGQTLFPQHKIYAMRDDFAKYGLIPGDVIESLETMLQGVPVTRIIEKDRSLDVFLRLDDESRRDIEAIKNLPAHILPTGEVIPLGRITDIFETSGPNLVERENLQRRIVISFNTSGRDLNSVVHDIQEQITDKVKLPEGYFVEFGGQYESQRQAARLVAVLGLVSLLGIFFVLYAHFKSAGLSLQIMVNVPLALVGSVVAIMLTERTFSIATLIAFITLCGIASRNGIMMISHYIHLMKEEGEAFSKHMVIRGSLERLAPVLMTAFSAILALTPLLFAKDQPGKEILHPVAVVIVGGLLSSTLLDIFVTPAIFYRFGRKAAERLASEKPTEEEI